MTNGIRLSPLWAWLAWVTVSISLHSGACGNEQTSWRSTLYPESWNPPNSSASFDSAKLIQDFSYAGYRRGEQPVPMVEGPLFEVTAFGADPSGTADSTAAIQAAINAAAAAGGGVVVLPAGLFLVSPVAGANHCLRIAEPNVVLRGSGAAETFLLNTSHQMRDRAVIRISPASTSSGNAVAITTDLTGPTRRIPVASPAAFTVGNTVRLEWSFTDEWIAEHNQQTWWNGTARPARARYLREVTAVNSSEGWIEVDVPARYTLKARDLAQVIPQQGRLSGVGIEDLALGNLEHPGSGWGESDYTDPTKAAYDTHNSWLIDISGASDCWISGVTSRQAATNTSTCHLLSNGIRLLNCFRVTLRDTTIRRPQYGGGGGNGYMFRLQQSNECLLVRCLAAFSRHGFVISHPGTSGNVFHLCEDRDTARATGSTGSYTTSGSGSDNHMHFSHSNLWDRCHVHNSFWTAHHRGFSGTTPHGLTSAHAVYWNTTGSGTRYPTIVRSEQARYGYVIGTSGTASGVSNPTGGNTSPADHVEGVGTGAALEPQSLYLDQLERRVFPPLKIVLTSATIRFPNNNIRADASASKGEMVIADLDSITWSVTAAPPGAQITAAAANTREPAFAVSSPGTYTIQAEAEWQGESTTATLVIEVLPPLHPQANFDLPPVADAYVRDAPYENENYGAEPSILIKNDGASHVRREGYTRFDLSGIPAAQVAGATLRLHFTSTDTAATGHSAIVAENGWQEMSLTWNTRPTTETAILGQWTPPAEDWLALDASAAILAQLAEPGPITFRHRILSQPSGPIYQIASREHPFPALAPVLRIHRRLPTLEEWFAGFPGLPEDARDSLDDPDGDGLPNLVEAWLGTHPATPDAGALPEISIVSDQILIQMALNGDPPDGLIHYIEHSENLAAGDWMPAPGVVWESATATNGRLPTTARIPMDPSVQRGFYRVKITRVRPGG